MLPLRDENLSNKKFHVVTTSILCLNVFLFVLTYYSEDFIGIIYQYGAVPTYIEEGKNLLSIISANFLHASWLHLIGNMWFFWIFADNLEENMGKIKFIFFYFLVGIISIIIHTFTIHGADANIPIIGASGAISGVIGAYARLFPKNKIHIVTTIFYRPKLYIIPAYLYTGLWFLIQILYLNSPTNISYVAHIAGFLSGMLLSNWFGQNISRIDYAQKGEKLTTINSDGWG